MEQLSNQESNLETKIEKCMKRKIPYVKVQSSKTDVKKKFDPNT